MEATASLELIDALIVVGFLVVVTIVGYMMSKIASQGLDDYFLGGRKIPWWVLGISTSTSNFDMAGTMIIVALVFSLGYKGMLVEIRGGVGMALPFLMVFLGKWLRRSRVMTSAEWMKLRFGLDKQGRSAHLLSAIANIILSLGMIAYFAKGAGAFLTHFLPLSEVTCTTIMVVIGLFYTLMSGLYGVVFTDVLQMILLTFTAIYVTVEAYTVAPAVEMSEGFLALDLASPEGTGAGLLAADPSTWEPIFAMFGLCVFMWVIRSSLEGMGGIGGYTDQRFFAARTEREASLLTLEAIILSVFRWTMVAGLVVMGLYIVQEGSPGAEVIAEDAEAVLPIVLGNLLPAGIKGLVLAGLIAAAMSTFDSTLNAGASYIVKDVYESYVNPEADQKQLMSVSRWATIGLCIAGIGLAAIIPNINAIWGLITMGLGAGLFSPLFLRWYWPRLNGYGFAIGTGVGIIGGLTYNAVFPYLASPDVGMLPASMDWPLYIAFPVTIGTGFLATVITSLVTEKTSDTILIRFWHQINPWGFWGKYENKAKEKELVTDEAALERQLERLNDVVAIAFALPFQLSLLLAGMAFVWHDWKKFSFFSIIVVITSIGLYFFWYRNLKDEKISNAEDEYFDDLAFGELAPEALAASDKLVEQVGSDEESDEEESDDSEE